MPIPRPAGTPLPGPTGSYNMLESLDIQHSLSKEEQTDGVLLILVDDRRRSFNADADNSLSS